ncbi:RNA polymerase sigma factor [Actinokineospora sp. NBRC 105648]|uniref:RNA polymerase sigma factor n=1 Tax=Actinokineospora sp. NBRC 105648 TaxID=3032206 RepID=UPI0024A14949|nr:RNA polymerase sigma factor [Actinokineospora sp. NBRC 105648]GLZ38163.1 RNA polymerase subunit sigma-24 [Actinokineospora sp. NBRC 105648]
MNAHDAVERAYRAEWTRVVATLIRTVGDWDLAEECAQEAFAQAVRRWPEDGVPDRPGAWLTTTARNRAVDVLRREAVGAAKLRQVAVFQQEDPHEIVDDRLRLIFTCCHPALALEARVALTLRAVAGLTTAEIARAFLVPEAAMSKRITRAKGKIRDAGIPYRVPSAETLPARMTAVLGVVYLLFNEGYSDREVLSAEAIRLARMLVELLPDEPEPAGLLALLLLHEARRPGRFVDGDLVLLDDQDRSIWDSSAIADGLSLLDKTLLIGRPGPYQVQAAIAACHATAKTAAETDWPQIAALYGTLSLMLPSPVVTLNRAVAVAMVRGPAAGLDLLDGVDLPGYHLLPATRADLLTRLGRVDEAAEAYRAALALAPTEPERRFLSARLVRLGAARSSSGGQLPKGPP